MEVKMIHKKELKFSRNGIDFNATVTYRDELFISAAREGFSVYYRIQLHEPVELDCGGASLSRPRGFGMYLLQSEAYQTRRYFYKEDEVIKDENGELEYIVNTYVDIYKEDENIQEEDNQINVYPLAIEKILYIYFNQKRIMYYNKKIERFGNAIENKYADALEVLQEQKLALRKLMRSGDIDSKEYQKRYTPIRWAKEEIESKIYWPKHNYRRRYFECCELKKAYRIYALEKDEK